MSMSKSSQGWAISDSSESEDEDTASLLKPIKASSDSNPSNVPRKYASPARIKQKQLLQRDHNSGSATKSDDKIIPGLQMKSKNDVTKSELQSKRRKVETASRDPAVVWRESLPLNYVLSTVTGLPDQFNYHHPNTPLGSLDIKDILSTEFGDLLETAQFNYCVDAAWFLEQLPPQKRQIPILLVHGERGADYTGLQRDRYPNLKTCKVELPPFGTHHTKMMLLRYKIGVRVIIHTCNLVAKDWHQKTQGLWISPVFGLSGRADSAVESKFCFKTDLIDYLKSYKRHGVLQKWIDLIAQHDLSSAKVVLIGSVPGRHRDSALSKWGHVRLQHVLREYVEDVSNWPVIGQFSSIGSLGSDKDKWLCAEWLRSLSSAKVKRFGSIGTLSSNAPLKLIFPTVANVRMSLEGYPAGASIPYNFSVAKKQVWLGSFLHNWKSRYLVRTQAAPHIKSYARVDKDFTKAAWFLLTSSNLSKAAWGAFEKKGSQLAIKSYELGVLFLPQRFYDDGAKTFFRLTSSPGVKPELVLPYSTPIIPYAESDEPWVWDIQHKEFPDRHGNMWVPS